MHYFTVVYKEECLYSVKARLLRDSLYNQVGGATLTYLGSFRTNSIDLELPCYINELVEDTKQFIPWSVESIIRNHTLLPLYQAFVLAEKHPTITNAMAGSNRDVHALVGIKSSSLIRTRLPRFCPLCCEIDINEFGETFFHRIHQIPNIQICPDHNCFLIDYNPQIQELQGIKYFYLTGEKIKNSVVSLNSCDTLKEIGQEFKSILANNSSSNYKEINYKEIFESLGYFRNGLLQRTDLNSQFKKFYQEVKNEYLLSRIAESYTWIGELILNPDRVLNPFQHVLFKKFADTLSQKIVSKVHPFGNGPWVCFNRASDHYLKDVVVDMKIDFNRNQNKIIGVFSCSCGLIYAKTFIKRTEGIQEKFIIIERGDLWHAKLDKCIADDVSIVETARILGTNNSTVIKYINKKSISKVIRGKRTLWRKVLKQMSYSEARINESSLYKWLFRNDRDWLLSTKSKVRTANPLQLRLNWNEVDDKLCEEINLAVEKIKQTNSRVSKKLIARLANNGKYIHGTDLERLPKAKALLGQEVESIEDHQLRRIQAAITDLSDQGRSVSKWNILRMASIKNPSIKMLNKIENYL